MANTLPLTELVSHIVRVYTTNGPIEFAAYEKQEAIILARFLYKDIQIYKVHVFDFKTEKKIFELT